MCLQYNALFKTFLIYWTQTQILLFTSKIYEKHLWKSILSKDAGHPTAFLLKIPLFHRCFSNILLIKATTWFLYKRRIGWKCVNQFYQHLSNSLAHFKRCHKMFNTAALLWRNAAISFWLASFKILQKRSLFFDHFY